MGLGDSFRQLYLLLWKNYVLRKRKKLRIVVEILWPLFLFLLLMWVRTRGLITYEHQCHFTERPLPSAGVIPFLRGFICELNNSCSATPRESYTSDQMLQLTDVNSDIFEFLNDPQVVTSVTTLFEFGKILLDKREQASVITKQIQLREVLIDGVATFTQRIFELGLAPLVNITMLNLILESNPNFNFLYSNYSNNYSEPLLDLIDDENLAMVPTAAFNLLYGSELDRLDVNRNSNQVYNNAWLRDQMCVPNTNLLLRGVNGQNLSNYLCSNFNDSQLPDLFILISTQLDITRAKNKVYQEIYIDVKFFGDLFKVASAAATLQMKFQQANILASNDIQSVSDLYDQIMSVDLGKTICRGSQLSIFTVINSIRLIIPSSEKITRIGTELSKNKDYAKALMDIVQVDLAKLSGINLDIKVPEYYRNPYEPLDKTPSSVNNTARAGTKTSTKANSLDNNSLETLTLILIGLNNLKSVSKEDCPVQRFEADLDPATLLLVNSTTKSCFCQQLYAIMNGASKSASTLFKYVKPIFLGKILYSPNTPAYNELIKGVNSTFNDIRSFGEILKNVSEMVEQTRLGLATPETQETVTAIILTLNQVLAAQNITIASLDYTTLDKQLRFVSELILFVHNSMGCIELDKFVGFPNENEAVDLGMKLIDKEAFWAAIIFENPQINDTTLPKIVKYKIRMNSSQVHDTTYTQDRFYNYYQSNCLGCNVYFTYGFIYIQDMIEKSIIELKTNSSQNFGLSAQMTPYPCYISDQFVRAISRSLPLFMVLAWIYTVSMMVKDIVYEKEKRLKEFMRVMGLSNATHWAAWFITSFLVMGTISFLLAIVLKYGKITQYTELTILLAFLWCFTISTICQCFLISVFFNKANLAAVIAGIVYFILYLPYTLLINYSDVVLPYQKFLASLSSTVAFSYGCELIATFELQAKGVQWDNFYTSPFNRYDGFSMNVVCLILLFDALIYLILTWYIETVWPGEFGVPKPWYFPLNPYYWLGENSRILNKCFPSRDLENHVESTKPIPRLYRRIFTDYKRQIIKAEEALQAANVADRESSIEHLSSHTPAGIQIKQLHKVYSRGNNHALKGLSIDFYENEITAFLGHNGAGKSTTMHLLTGLYKPTSGTAKINGMDIRDNMFKIRKSLGFVPQHNVLFPGMTVEEHLWFYARLKGLGRNATEIELNKLLDDTGLRSKKKELSKNLSGGMQRKLSVAIAFVGGSKTVILDEPSAGVDPSGRRSIWDLLFKYRQGRTIVISTHHMDEADVLGDRLAIISNGKLIAHGTSFFLKRRFGRGYYLTIAKKDNDSYDQSNEMKTDNRKNSTPSNSSTDSGLSVNEFETSPKSSLNNHKYRAVDASDDLDEIEKAQKLREKEVLASLTNKQDIVLYDFIKKRIENASLVENIGLEMKFSISNQVEFTRGYEKFFRDLERNMETLGIDSIGISDTTLEEIFIKLAKEPKSNHFKSPRKLFGFNVPTLSCFKEVPAKQLNEKELQDYAELTKTRVNSPVTAVFKQLYALLVKRVHRVKRNKKGFLAEIVLPVLFVCLALLVATLLPGVEDRPNLEVHPWYYDTPNQIFLSKSSSLEFEQPFYDEDGQLTSQTDPAKQANLKEIERVVDTFYLPASIGTRCMKGYEIKISPQAQDYRRAQLGSQLQCADFDWKLLQNYSRPSQEIVNQFNLANYSYTRISSECDCSGGFPVCPASAGGDINYRRITELRTKDHLYDLTSRNVTDWLIKTEFDVQFFRKRFGGFEFLQTNDSNEKVLKNFETTLSNFLKLFNMGTELVFDSEQLMRRQNIRVWYNVKGYEASVGYLNVLNNQLLRSKLSDDVSGEHGIVAFNHPMKFTKVQFFDDLERRIVIDLFVSIFIIFALSFIPASFLVFLLEERENRSKQLQLVSGVKPYIYWASNFIWDLFNYIVPCLLCVLLFLLFNVQAYINPVNFPCLVLLLLLYGWACIPLMYPLNYLFKVSSTAFVASSSFNVFIGIVSVMSTTILDNLADEDPDLADVNYYLKPIFTIVFPHYCLGRGLLDMAILYNKATASQSFGFNTKQESPFEFDNVGKNLLALTIQGVLFYTINLLIEYKFFIRFKPISDLRKLYLPQLEDEDDDVVSERHRILNQEPDHQGRRNNNKKRNRYRPSEDAFETAYDDKNLEVVNRPDADNDDYIKLINLTKVYKKYQPLKCRIKKHVAVNALSLGIKKGECFGLIGVNGAGKTTTFKMITGDIPISGGDVTVNGYSVSKQIEKVHRSIGYCPQFDALMPLLTSREHLIFFARLRGIPERNVINVSEWAMNKVGLNVFADRIAGDLSGGNKRKLSTAIALVGNPSVICLDEPTSGMDAKARRLLWNDILNLIKDNRIVILTSHSMEECEALCTRLVIMVNGQFKCLGSTQHLKTKFGNGYLLSVRLNEESESQMLFGFMAKNFPTAQIQETHKNLFEFVLPFGDTKLSQIFGKIEKNRECLNIKDYSVSQSTLDQIFVNFAKSQDDEKDASSGKNKFIKGFSSPLATVKGVVQSKPTNNMKVEAANNLDKENQFDVDIVGPKVVDAYNKQTTKF